MRRWLGLLAVVGGIQLALLAGWSAQAAPRSATPAPSAPAPAPVAHGAPGTCPAGAQCNPATPTGEVGTGMLVAVTAVLGAGAVAVVASARFRRRQPASRLAAGFAVVVARPPQALSLVP